MNWIEALYKTYENHLHSVGVYKTKVIRKGSKNESQRTVTPLLPLFHGIQNSHITIGLDESGNIKYAKVNSETELPTIIPVTEDSESRSSGLAPYPLCDKLQYVAGDNVRFFQPEKKRDEQLKKLDESYKAYLVQIRKWAEFDPDNTPLQAILAYVEKGTLIQDLVKMEILFLDDEDAYLAESWNGPIKEQPPIFGVMKPASQESAFIRWEVVGDCDCHEVYLSHDMYQSWMRYAPILLPLKGLCYISGEEQQLSGKFPKRLRNAGDNAKIISSNDKDGYTFRGRFIEAEESFGLSAEVSQKAHSALRWLLSRQGYFDGEQAILIWSPELLKVPSPCESSIEWNNHGDSEEVDNTSDQIAVRFSGMIHSGIKGDKVWDALGQDLRDQKVMLLSLDAASPGRLSITRYLEFSLSDYFANLLHWYIHSKWLQSNMWLSHEDSKKEFVGSPSPRMIVTAAYGKDIDEKLRRYAVSRILPSILLRDKIPADIEKQCFVRASQKNSLQRYEWEMTLGVACSIYIYNHNQEEGNHYTMSLDTERKNRNYLYGRLWAVAEVLEKTALDVTKTSRSTNAERLMQRFQTRPFETWTLMESNCLQPYQLILKKNKKGLKNYYDSVIDAIMNTFSAEDFENNAPLDGAYLLGYHCQKVELYRKKKEDDVTSDGGDVESSEE